MSIPLATQREFERWYNLKPHPIQLELVRDNVRFKVVPAGRRCLAEGTMVATPKGPMSIESLSIGDIVFGYNEDGSISEATVSKTWENGEKEVVSLMSSNCEYLQATEKHRLLACNEAYFDKRRPHLKHLHNYKKTEVSSLSRRSRVRRVYLGDMIKGGSKALINTYSLGALTGDGCSRESKSITHQYQTNIYVSSENDNIPARIAAEIGGTLSPPKHNNHTYKINCGLRAVDIIPFYKEWVDGRYAHDKIADWNEIDTWERKTALAYLAGIIDTDGSIYYKTPRKKEAVINISMQSESVVLACQKIIFKYFQEMPTISIDRREKYKNGCVYSLKTTSNIQAINIVLSLKGISLKADKMDLLTLKVKNVMADRIGLLLGKHEVKRTYDITVDNETNMYVLHHGGLITSNSGKTERFKRFVVKQAMSNPNMPYFAGAPTRDQAKRIFWKDLKALSLSTTHIKKPYETDLIIEMNNGATISVIGFDKPERFEGQLWAGGGIDEFGDLKDDAWESHIAPALDTYNPTMPDYRAWCWLFGVPEGLNFYYDLFVYAKKSGDPDWKAYSWPSAAILPQETIDAAKRRMSAKQYRQEYEASFENAGGRIYEDYGFDNHCKYEIQPHEALMWAHDQNFTPLSSCIAVLRGDKLLILDEIVLTSAVSKQSALEFVEKFKNHKNKTVYIYGDPAGRAGEKHGHRSDYTDIEDVLRLNGWDFKRRVKLSHPAIKDRQNAVRAMVKSADGYIRLFVNPVTAPWSDKGLATVQLKEGSSFQEDQTNKYQHITTAIGYMTDYEFPINEPVIKAPIIFSR